MNHRFFSGLFVVLLLGCLTVSTDADTWLEANASSQRDLLYIDMPDSVHRLEAMTATVYINDPLIKEQANVIELSPDNDNFFSVGKKVEKDSSGVVRTFVPYAGEGSVSVGFMTNDYYTNDLSYATTPDIYFSFYNVKKVSGNDYPDTSSQSSEYYQYQCATYYTTYFCSSDKGCIVCTKLLGTVYRQYELLPAKAVGTPPAGYNWVDGRGTDASLLVNPGFLAYGYSESDKPIGQNDKYGKPITCDDSFSVKLDVIQDQDWDFPAFEKKQEEYNKAGISSGKVSVKLTAGPGGLFSGKAVEILSVDSTSYDSDWFSIGYTLYADYTPPGSGLGEVSMTRQGCAPKGGGKGAIDKALSDVRNFAAGYSVQNMGARTNKALFHYYRVVSRDIPSAITGRITDGHGNPMPYMTVQIAYDDHDYDGQTDVNGNYEVNIPNLAVDSSNPKIGTLRLFLSYNRDGKNYYTVLDHLMGDRLVTVEKQFSLETEMDKKQDFDFGTTSFTDTKSSSILANLKHIGPVYYHLSEVTDYALTQLKANIDYKLPVDVIFASDASTAYSRDSSTININFTDSAYDSTNRPDNREYHEFCHHIMFSQWNGAGLRSPGDLNHGGFMNNDTGDSYTEGFAEFCAMTVAKYRANPKPEIYAGFGSFELKYKPWEHRGYDEELAVAGTLWDLYDNDDNDSLGLPLDKLWDVLKVRRANFYEYYKALKAAFPDKADSIDKVFIAHGFFEDKHAGNGIWDVQEPFKDANKNGAYDAGEYFVDYGNVSGEAKPTMKYVNGYVIGKATNYNRLVRGAMFEVPNSFVKAQDPRVRKYHVSVHFNDPAQGEDYSYDVTAADGLVYVAPIPEDLDAVIKVEPLSKDYTAGKTYSITNKEYIEKYFNTPVDQGYYSPYDFEVKPTGTHQDDADQVATTGSQGQTSGTVAKTTIANGSGSGAAVPIWAIGGGLIMIGGGIIFVVFVIAAVLLLRKKK